MLYSPGNTAKEWILRDIEQTLDDRNIRILDLACGSAWVWEGFLPAHSNVRVLGVDTDAQALEVGRKRYANLPAIELRHFDAQHPLEEKSFDVVVALSAMEHVVDHAAFLRTARDALKPGGVAYLNYDAGHFRSHSLKERLMVPVSQLLAMIGMEKWYMKQVDDAAFRTIAVQQGFSVEAIRKHNIGKLKGFMKKAPAEAVEEWYGFEERLGAVLPPDRLDSLMLSTTFKLRKP